MRQFISICVLLVVTAFQVRSDEIGEREPLVLPSGGSIYIKNKTVDGAPFAQSLNRTPVYGECDFEKDSHEATIESVMQTITHAELERLAAFSGMILEKDDRVENADGEVLSNLITEKKDIKADPNINHALRALFHAREYLMHNDYRDEGHALVALSMIERAISELQDWKH